MQAVKKLLIFIAPFLLPLCLSSCITIGTTIANIPTYFDAMERKPDIAYGKKDRQKLDIYWPADTRKSASLPVVVFIYGGGWKSGSKEQYRFVAARFVDAGYMVVIPDYIKYPQAKFPAFVDDAARAVAWTEKHIHEYGGDASRLYLMGHSAGAHTGALLVSDQHYLEAYGSSPNIIAAFVGLAGPYAFTPDDPDLMDIFGPPERYKQMQVPNFVDGTEPPMLLLTGAEDQTVGEFNLTQLASTITYKGGRVTTKIYPGLGHIGIIRGFALGDGEATPVAEDAIKFFKKHQI